MESLSGGVCLMRIYVLTCRSRNGGRLAKVVQILQLMDVLDDIHFECVDDE